MHFYEQELFTLLSIFCHWRAVKQLKDNERQKIWKSEPTGHPIHFLTFQSLLQFILTTFQRHTKIERRTPVPPTWALPNSKTSSGHLCFVYSTPTSARSIQHEVRRGRKKERESVMCSINVTNVTLVSVSCVINVTLISLTV